MNYPIISLHFIYSFINIFLIYSVIQGCLFAPPPPMSRYSLLSHQKEAILKSYFMALATLFRFFSFLLDLRLGPLLYSPVYSWHHTGSGNVPWRSLLAFPGGAVEAACWAGRKGEHGLLVTTDPEPRFLASYLNS